MSFLKSLFFICISLQSLVILGQKGKIDYDEEGNVKDDFIHLFFPKEIEKMAIGKLYKYPYKELGYSVGYNGENDFKATVYVYNNGVTNIPTGYDSKVVKDNLNMVSKSLQILQERGTYKDLKLTGMSIFKPEKSKLTFLRSDYSYIEKHSGGTETNPLESHCFITGFAENFIKIRFTYPKEHMVEGRKKVKKFISEIAIQLKKSQEVFKKEGLGFTIYADFMEGNEDASAAWLAYILTRQQYIMENLDKYIEVPGIISSRFEEELDARSGMLSVWEEIKSNNKSLQNKYFDDLSKVKNKGFMKEYVWTFHNRDGWEEPKDLKLKQFEIWKKENIPEHKAETQGALGFSRNEKENDN